MMMGGTELSMLHLRERVEVPDSVHLHLSVVDEAALSVSKRHVVWLHQSYDQPSVQNLPRVVDRLDHLVFVSHWQREQYRRYLLPSLPLEKTTVIRNAVALPRDYPASHAELRDSSVTRLIYSSTPFRGLDVLLDAMDLVRDDAIHLDVYSSMRVYGPSHARLDSQFEHLYERCRSDSRVTYHGSVDQTTLHRAFSRADALAYPCTWEETSCITAMEAMTHGCLVVCSDIGALPETTAGLAVTYTPGPRHAEQYARVLADAVRGLRAGEYVGRLRAQVAYARQAFSWHERAVEWDRFFDKYRRVKDSIWRI